ncbi:MAG: pyruvate formate lyase-activating protein, partial [Deltaproteobacteria bacterium]|nr:pyruvate formate lyase-activating protein [Deltaproteobacteria bacterium]
FEVAIPETMAIALQDHGFSPRASNRLSRFLEWRRFLEAGGEIKDLLYTAPPPRLTRMAAALKAKPGSFLMDTGAAALRGAVLDDFAAKHLATGIIALNAGNSHTVAALVKGSQVWGIYEHHTHLLTPSILADQIKRFAQASLTHEEVFDQDGHGVAYNPEYLKLKAFEHIVVTGPRREVAANLGHPAAPFGEMMLSGCFGLVEAVRQYRNQEV